MLTETFCKGAFGSRSCDSCLAGQRKSEAILGYTVRLCSSFSSVAAIKILIKSNLQKGMVYLQFQIPDHHWGKWRQAGGLLFYRAFLLTKDAAGTPEGDITVCFLHRPAYTQLASLYSSGVGMGHPQWPGFSYIS